jgi:hypothetical protein
MVVPERDPGFEIDLCQQLPCLQRKLYAAEKVNLKEIKKELSLSRIQAMEGNARGQTCHTNN